MKERYLSKTPFLTFVYISKCNINLPGYFGNSKKMFLWTGLLGSLVEVNYTEPMLLTTTDSFCWRNAQVCKKERCSDFWSHISWSLPKSGSGSRTPSHNRDNSGDTSSWELTAKSWTRGLSRGRRGRTRYSAKSIQADHLQDINSQNLLGPTCGKYHGTHWVFFSASFIRHSSLQLSTV